MNTKFLVLRHPTDFKGAVADNGVSTRSADRVIEGLKQSGVDEKDIFSATTIEGLLKEAQDGSASQKQTLVVPGGNAAIMHSNIKSLVKEQLKKNIEAGALNYVGICAGSYLASEKVFPVDGNSYSMLGLKAGLHVFGRYGVKITAGSFPARREVPVKTQGGAKATLAWVGGPEFEDADSAPINGYRSLVDAEDDNLPAMISMPAGRGMITLSSMHVEVALPGETAQATEARMSIFRALFGLDD